MRILLLLLPVAAPLPAQVPPGPPYIVGTHLNPIVTFVEETDFVATSYEDARKQAGFELLGLSGAEGRLEEIAVAPGKVEEVRILGREVEVLFYPVIRQRFALAGGGLLTLYAFRNPRSGVPTEALNQHAFRAEGSPENRRFGLSPLPGELLVRRTTALIFENDGERCLFWQESDRSYVASSSADLDTLALLVEDLL